MIEALDVEISQETLLFLPENDVFLYNILREELIRNPFAIEEHVKRLNESGMYENIRTTDRAFNLDGTPALNYVALVATRVRNNHEPR